VNGAPPVGTMITPLTRTPDVGTLFEFCAACWITHRIHYDVQYASVEGHPGVVVPGPLQGAYLTQMATLWAGATGGELVRISFKHRDRAFAGRTLVSAGRVVDIDGQTTRCEVWIDDVDDGGGRTTEGECEISYAG
jgi:hydroxyacyl-ACP dehydratase HTD2-like protein with hotdog domain